MSDMKGLEPKWCCMEINGSEKTNTTQTQVSFDLLLASWPLTVAIQVRAVTIDVSVTDKIYILSELEYCIHLSLFGADEISLLANGKNSVLIADTYL